LRQFLRCWVTAFARECPEETASGCWCSAGD